MSEKTERRDQDCKDIIWKIGPFVDGELPADERAEVELHMDTCKDCVQLAIDFRQLDTLAARDRVPQVAGEEWARLWQGVLAGSRGPAEAEVISSHGGSRFRRGILSVLSAAAAVIIGIAIGSVYFGGSKPGASSPESNTFEGPGRDGDAHLPSGPSPTISEENDVIIIDYSKPNREPPKPAGR